MEKKDNDKIKKSVQTSSACGFAVSTYRRRNAKRDHYWNISEHLCPSACVSRVIQVFAYAKLMVQIMFVVTKQLISVFIYAT